jgi:anti-sigma factor RsiW
MSSGISEDDLVALNALVDGELDQAATTELERRIAEESGLRLARDALNATRQAVTRLPQSAVSNELLAQISALADRAAIEVPQGPARRGNMRGFSWRGLAASIVLSALAASGLTYSLVGARDVSLDQLIADAHRRSLLAASPVDVASSDRHTTKPWLDARLGLSPPAPDLATQGYALAGGRVDVLAEQVVPTLVYRHNAHTISLIARPESGGTTQSCDFSSGGYNMVRWTEAGFLFTAVSDLEPGELDAFAADYRSQLGSAGTNR